MKFDKKSGLLDKAEYLASPNYDKRELYQPEVIVIHSISLPPGDYNNQYVEAFFCNQLDCQAEPYFKTLQNVEVSSHFYIRRNGEIVQFVPTHLRAWHAGESHCLERGKVNDFSIGIELQGLDIGDDGYTAKQYKSLNQLIACLRRVYPQIQANNIFAHSDIAPGRKEDPGAYFDWTKIDNN